MNAGDARNLTSFLAATKSHLKKARIEYNFLNGYADDIAHNPSLALLPSTATLEHLVLYSPTLELDGVIFPRVATLQISDYTLRLEPLLRAFPNLRHLTLLECFPEEPVALRADNQIACSQDGWSGLQYLDASYRDVYVLGLILPVRRWQTAVSLCEEDAKDKFEACLRGMKPTALSLIRYIYENELVDPVSLALAETKLTHLCLDITSPVVAPGSFMVGHIPRPDINGLTHFS